MTRELLGAVNVNDSRASEPSPDERTGPAMAPGPASAPQTSNGVPPALATVAAWLWRLLLVAVGIWLATAVARRLWLLLAPMAVAVVFTALLKPLVDRLHRRGCPRLLGTWAVLAGALLLLAGLVAVLTPRFVQQIDQLSPALEDALATLESWLINGPLDLERARVNDLRQRALDVFSPGGGEASGALTGAVLAFEALAAAALCLVLTFFFIKDGDVIVSWPVHQLDERLRAPARRMGRAAWRALAGYLRGLVLVAGFNAVATAVGLAVIGVPLFLSLAVVEFFFSFVPILGSIAAGALAAAVALSVGGATKALLVVALAVAIDQVEGNLFQPVVIGRSVKLHPVVVLVALTTGGILFGIAGLLLAVPLTAMATAATGDLQRWRRGEE